MNGIVKDEVDSLAEYKFQQLIKTARIRASNLGRTHKQTLLEPKKQNNIICLESYRNERRKRKTG